ncbi:amino acid ABC transporter permease [Lacibacterium aquatile]|uniref:Amino acid ABC transporter permease n=1 Tax=Lacibacterium aquatile TaxID=1168082 RepID=A0ABW5DND0_9PROT
MSELTTSAPVEKPPASETGVVGWLRANLFNSWLNSVLTVVCVAFIVYAVSKIVPWAFFKATWVSQGLDATGKAITPDQCRAAGGACWAIVHEKGRFTLFGRYSYIEQWRPALAILTFVGLVGVSCYRRFWGNALLTAWGMQVFVWTALLWGGNPAAWTAIVLTVATLALAAFKRFRGPAVITAGGFAVFIWLVVLFGGMINDPQNGFFNLKYVSHEEWGGLPLTLLMSMIAIVFGYPMGIILALGRRSHLPVARAVCVAYIELIRGVPLISVLFMASFMIPLFFPEGVSIDKLLRAQIGFTLFLGAYLAEVIRGGLQAIPKGQYEAADALGLGYWTKMRKIILPQALRLVIPPMVNSFISTFKDTSLVIVIGLFDLLSAGKAALTDPPWRSFYIEMYVFLALIYFAFCFTMSKFSQRLEYDLRKGTSR